MPQPYRNDAPTRTTPSRRTARRSRPRRCAATADGIVARWPACSTTLSALNSTSAARIAPSAARPPNQPTASMVTCRPPLRAAKSIT
ncbi:hypothetical protein ACFQYP_02190 [Nonomuraea antimicrobica]